MPEKQIGVVGNYFEKVGAIALKLDAPLKVGDTIRIQGGAKNFEQLVESMQINRAPVESAKKGNEVGILVKEAAHKGYKVFKK